VSGLELALRNLGAWSVQVAVLALAAAALSRLAPVDRARARLALWQALLVVVLVLPLLQARRPAPASERVATYVTAAPGVSGGRAAAPGNALEAMRRGGSAFAAGLLLLGVAVQLARLAAGLARLRALRRDARPLAAEAWLLQLRDAVAPTASFAVSDRAAGPATFGIRRPLVLLPAFFASMERDRQRAVVLHELLHARRRDWLALLLEEVLKAALFFHPAVHWLVARVRLAREEHVDAEVVRRLGQRSTYLESLLEVARFAVRTRAVPVAPFLRESHLRERVDLLLKEVSMSRARTVAHVGATALAVLLAVAWASSAVPLQASQPLAAKPAAAAPPAHIGVEDRVDAPAPPRLVRQPRPVYPESARAEKVEGVFMIDVVIGKDGAVRDAKVVASAATLERLKQLEPQKGTPAALEGDGRLAAAALESVRQWQYEPILKDAKPVEFQATVHVRFQLG
jgi:beta-lactamase regulating signal transducer with metallopeptidase domain